MRSKYCWMSISAVVVQEGELFSCRDHYVFIIISCFIGGANWWNGDLNVFFQAVLWGEILIDSLGPLRLQWLVRQALGWSSPVVQWLHVRHHTVLRPVLPRAVPRVQSFFMMQTLS